MNAAADLLGPMTDAGAAFWRASWQASVLALLVCIVQLTFGRRIPPRWRHTMWLLVFVRLALPVVPSSPLSVFNLTPAANTPDASPSGVHVASVVDEIHSNVRANVGTFCRRFGECARRQSRGTLTYSDAGGASDASGWSVIWPLVWS